MKKALNYLQASMLKNKKLWCNHVLSEIKILFPNAGCELIYHNTYELLIAVVLSAQTTDVSVNKVTPLLFSKYPTVDKLAEASLEDVMSIIKPIGLYKNKSTNIINLSKKICQDFDMKVPDNFEDLTSLPGVGRKTANVVLAEGFNIPRIAVDTHVERVSKRLDLVENNKSVLEVELELMGLIEQKDWHKGHHYLLFFGRYFCTAKKPRCNECFHKECKYKI